jgi:hypothetical protein
MGAAMMNYLIWSNEHRQWWGVGSCGYVTRVSEAGRYTREAALSVCREALGTAGHIKMLAELPVREDDVKEFLAGAMIPGGLA